MREDKGKVQKKSSKRKMNKMSRGRSGRKMKQKERIQGKQIISLFICPDHFREGLSYV